VNIDERLNRSVLLSNREFPEQITHFTLKDCLEFYAQRETLDENNPWICERCNEIVFPDKKVDIWSVPDVFIIHLKRFYGGYGVKLSKVEDFIDYPKEIDMRDFIVGPQKEREQKYRLYGVSNHYGSLDGGHYTANAIVQSPFGEVDRDAPWYLFDDASVSRSESDLCSSAGYVLFYEKI
jgi:ubiquitin C-terminal hydrolase